MAERKAPLGLPATHAEYLNRALPNEDSVYRAFENKDAHKMIGMIGKGEALPTESQGISIHRDKIRHQLQQMDAVNAQRLQEQIIQSRIKDIQEKGGGSEYVNHQIVGSDRGAFITAYEDISIYKQLGESLDRAGTGYINANKEALNNLNSRIQARMADETGIGNTLASIAGGTIGQITDMYGRPLSNIRDALEGFAEGSTAEKAFLGVSGALAVGAGVSMFAAFLPVSPIVAVGAGITGIVGGITTAAGSYNIARRSIFQGMLSSRLQVRDENNKIIDISDEEFDDMKRKSGALASSLAVLEVMASTVATGAGRIIMPTIGAAFGKTVGLGSAMMRRSTAQVAKEFGRKAAMKKALGIGGEGAIKRILKGGFVGQVTSGSEETFSSFVEAQVMQDTFEKQVMGLYKDGTYPSIDSVFDASGTDARGMMRIIKGVGLEMSLMPDSYVGSKFRLLHEGVQSFLGGAMMAAIQGAPLSLADSVVSFADTVLSNINPKVAEETANVASVLSKAEKTADANSVKDHISSTSPEMSSFINNIHQETTSGNNATKTLFKKMSDVEKERLIDDVCKGL